MPPHGRRRVSTFANVLVFLFLFAYTASAASAVLGIDLGTEYIKAALVKPGIPLEIVLTKDSKRKEIAAVAFKSSNINSKKSGTGIFPERIYGSDALAVAPRFPGDVYPNLKPLLGLSYNSHDVVSTYKERYPSLRTTECKGRGTVGFYSPSFEETEEPYLVEELLAMELKNIRANAVALAGKGSTIQDAVITVPPFYTAEEKMAVTLAAELAGLRVLSLISDGLSVGLNYATSRTFPTINEGGKPEIHLVFDMGAGSATATVLRFQGRTVKDVGRFNKTIQEVQILGTGWDKTLGGDALNQLIVEDMIMKLANMDRVKALGSDAKQIKEHGRTMAKLWKEAERLRQVLSANTETSTSFEGLFHEDVNFKYKLTRADFEKLAASYAGRVEEPLRKALESAKLDLADVVSVILHGGAVRTPFVQKQLESIVGNADKLRTNVNSDEAAVFGAAFKAAGISPSFRVKEIRTGDIAGYSYGFRWDRGDTEKQQMLFVPTSQTGAEKQVPLKVTEDLTFTLFEQGPNRPVTDVQTKNLTASVDQLIEKFGCSKNDISTSFAIRLSPTDGLPEVLRGSVSCETASQKSGVVDGVKDFFGFGSKKGDQEPLDENQAGGSTTAMPAQDTSATPSSKESSMSNPTHTDTASAAEKSKEPKKRTETICIEFSTQPAALPPLSTESLQRIKDRLTAFDASDRSRLKREETLNTLEAFTYKARDLLDDESFIAASTEKHRAEIEEQFKTASEWLYGEGTDASREELTARLDALHSLVDPVLTRKDEAKKRPQQVQSLQEALNQTKTMVSVIKQQMEYQSVAETASSIESASSEDSSSPTTTTPVSTDDFAELDDDTSTSLSATATPSAKAPPMFSYSEEDLQAITDAQDSVETWLNSKLAEQERLSPTDDPVLLSTELATKSKELNDMVMNLLTKQMKTPPKGKKPKVKSATVKAKSEKKSKPTVSPEDVLEDVPGGDKITEEEISEAIRQQESKTTEPKAKTKAKITGKKKGNGKDKGKSEVHGEL